MNFAGGMVSNASLALNTFTTIIHQLSLYVPFYGKSFRAIERDFHHHILFAIFETGPHVGHPIIPFKLNSGRVDMALIGNINFTVRGKVHLQLVFVHSLHNQFRLVMFGAIMGHRQFLIFIVVPDRHHFMRRALMKCLDQCPSGGSQFISS